MNKISCSYINYINAYFEFQMKIKNSNNSRSILNVCHKGRNKMKF